MSAVNATSSSRDVLDAQLLRCKFGATTVVATRLNHSALTCVTPSADASGVAVRRVLDFEEGTALTTEDLAGSRATAFAEPGLILLGDAVIQDGALKLTRSRPEQAGSILFTPPVLGGATSEGGPSSFPTAFRLSLRLTIGTGFMYEGPVATRGGGEGFSISIGDLPHATAGEYGIGDGLRVSLRTRANTLSVEYGDRPLHRGTLPQAERLRSNISFPVELTLRNDSVSLHLADTAALVDAPLPELRGDATPAWRFGLGARTNHIRGENHFVRELRLELGPSLDGATVGVSVTCNGQQYAPEDDTRLRIGYFGAPEPLAVEPALGPAGVGRRCPGREAVVRAALRARAKHEKRKSKETPENF